MSLVQKMPTAGAIRWHGRSQILAGFLTLAFLVLGIGAWVAFTTIHGAVIGSGIVEVETNRQVVQHQIGGVVGEILVQDGDVVTAGQVLMRFDEKIDRSELAIIEGQLYSLLGTQARLKAEQDDTPDIEFDPEMLARAKTDAEVQEMITGQTRLLKARRDTRDKQIGQLVERRKQITEQIDGLVDRVSALERQKSFIDSELVGQNQLLKEALTQTSRVMALEREGAEIDGDTSGARASVAENRARIAEIEIAILNVSSAMREEAITQLRTIEAQIAELRQRRIAAIETLSRMELRAPVGGVVFGLQVHALRAVVRAAEPILYIIPQDVGLVVTTNIAPSSIDQVHVGQKAELLFVAFDRHQTPDIKGTVIEVSADVFNDERSGASFYKVRILPDTGEIAKLGNAHIVPGMPVEAFIQTTERSPLAYLVKPLADYFNKAFRER